LSEILKQVEPIYYTQPRAHMLDNWTV